MLNELSSRDPLKDALFAARLRLDPELRWDTDRASNWKRRARGQTRTRGPGHKGEQTEEREGMTGRFQYEGTFFERPLE